MQPLRLLSSLSTSLMLTVKGCNPGKYVACRCKEQELWVEDGRVTIETLPDEVLLKVFDFCVHDIYTREAWWIRLTHVCQRWRYIIFTSPRRLDLTLECAGRKPVRELLDIWPPLPIVIDGDCSEEGADNILAALEHNDRLCEIRNFVEEASGLLLGRFARAMQGPFPQLTHLQLQSAYGTPVLPGTFLRGSAPRLRYCQVPNLPFPALRKLLLTASHLVRLRLDKIPHSVYISPEAMVACLAVATSLETLNFRLLSPRSRPNRATRRPPPLIRTILPALTDFGFHGASEYLEDFISRVDAPLLNVVYITLFHQLSLDVSQLHQFIGRTEALSALSIANVGLVGAHPRVRLSHQGRVLSRPCLTLSTYCNGSDWQLSFLDQACRSLLPTPFTVQTLNIFENTIRPLTPRWEDDMENDQWLELFHPFTSVKNLYLSNTVAPLVAPALQQLAEEGVTDVLPMLQNLYLEGLEPSGPIQGGIGQFIAARQLFNHPVTVVPWNESLRWM